ncbi:hypothetical protein UR09_03305 [Candidatus Nitromaritima sp. SCGC AAA799-A02]|nr:hypothetical protein UR09_03305 [Candidatus Nitromaritima sp. SCGC AAA799-A02]
MEPLQFSYNLTADANRQDPINEVYGYFNVEVIRTHLIPATQTLKFQKRRPTMGSREFAANLHKIQESRFEIGVDAQYLIQSWWVALP